MSEVVRRDANADIEEICEVVKRDFTGGHGFTPEQKA
jgi:hypothetical protein